MANRSYLIASNNDRIYPSATESNFDNKAQIIAQGSYCVPLLWFGLFRSSDMRTQEIQVDGHRWTGIAPIIDVGTAVAQLRHAVPLLDQMFPGANFTEYCEFLVQAVRSTGRKYVTIEMEEIADLDIPDEFYEGCRIALEMFSGDESVADGKDKLVLMSDIDEEADIPSARCLVDDMDVSDDDLETHSRIIGMSWARPVPWENNA